MSVELEINLIEIKKANERIEDGLNRRFEKDAEMYISNQEISFVKSALSKGEFEGLLDKFKAEKYHPDVYFRTILRNAWLIKEITPQQFHQTIRPILELVNPEFSKKLLNEVAENKLDVPEPFRRNLLKYYARTVDPLEAEEMIKNGESLGLKRITVLVQRVLSYYAGTTQFFTKWNQFAKQYPALVSSPNILSRITVEEDRIAKHYEILCEQYAREKEPQRYLENAVLNGKLVSFNMAFKNAKSDTLVIAKQPKGVRNDDTFENMKKWLKLLGRITHQIYFDKNLVDKQDQIYESLISLYESIYRINSYQAGQVIRHCFSKINHGNFKNKIIQYFDSGNGEYHYNFEDSIEELKNGKGEQAFEDIDELFDLLERTESKNTKYLGYLAIIFSKLSKSTNLENELLDEIDLSDAIHYSFLITLLRDGQSGLWKKMMDRAAKSTQFEQVLYFAVCTHVPKNQEVKLYMHRNHFEKYGQLYGAN